MCFKTSRARFPKAFTSGTVERIEQDAAAVGRLPGDELVDVAEHEPLLDLRCHRDRVEADVAKGLDEPGRS